MLSLTSVLPQAGAGGTDDPLPASAQEAFSRAQFVFAATVETRYADDRGFPSRAEAFWNKCWKGCADLPKLLTIDGGSAPSLPAQVFEAGETYLFYVNEKLADGSYRADPNLTRVLKFSEAEPDLIFLNQQK
ncbi:MAG: hypothetical protein AB7F70_01275 [Candidatus Omnitrophota bacterium]